MGLVSVFFGEGRGRGGHEGEDEGVWGRGGGGDGERMRADIKVLYRFRARATKKMTVELAEKGEGQGAFVWPEEPEDYSPYVTLPSILSPCPIPPPPPPSHPIPKLPNPPSLLLLLLLLLLPSPLPHPQLTTPPHSWGQAAIAEASQGQNSGRQNDMISNVKKQKQKIGGPRGMKDRKGGETIAQQARKLLRGEESWGPGWRDYGVGVGRGGVRGAREGEREREGGGK